MKFIWKAIFLKMTISSRIGDRFDAICTGAADKGTWVRIFLPPIEGRLLYGVEGVDVGDRLKVQLISTDVEKGYIDFKKIHWKISGKNGAAEILGRDRSTLRARMRKLGIRLP